MTEEAKKKIQEELSKLSTEDLIALNIVLREKQELEEEENKKARSAIMQEFLHPTTSQPVKDEDEDEDESIKEAEKRMAAIADKFKYR